MRHLYREKRIIIKSIIIMKSLDIELNLWPNAVNEKNSRMNILYFRVFCLFIKTSRTIDPI